MVTSFPLDIPQREHPRPRLTDAPPHLQMDQWPSPEITQALLVRCSTLEYTSTRESRMAGPTAVALRLTGSRTQGPSQAFIDDHEFCHIQGPPYGSLNLMLPPEIAKLVVDKGWGEPHVFTKAGFFFRTLTLIYAPRNAAELDVVMKIVEMSRDFARGCESLPLAGRRIRTRKPY